MLDDMLVCMYLANRTILVRIKKDPHKTENGERRLFMNRMKKRKNTIIRTYIVL